MSNARCRTVNDYKTPRALSKALKSVDEETPLPDDDESEENFNQGQDELKEDWDWVLTNYDVGTTLPQSISQELHRLQVLKSYLILDKDREEAFDRLTNMASRVFDCPIALVSLVDLGRQWLMSNHGLGDVRETPRSLAFCAHAIQGTFDVFQVKDTLEDARFRDSPLVQGAPFIRFYAGTPLLSPEGYKLGTFCIIDSEPRPNGLSDDDQANLKDFAAMAMRAMVDRRKIISQDDTAHIVACTAHDLLTPLMGVQLSLSLLEEDPALGDTHRESLSNAIRSSDWLQRICSTTMETIRDNPSDDQSNKPCPWMNLSPAADTSALPPCTCGGNHNSEAPINGASGADHRSPMIDMKEFVSSLNHTMESIPKRVPLILTVDKSVPTKIISDELKLFRSSLNLLSNAFANTTTGSVRFHIRRSSIEKERDQSCLVFECADTGKNLEIQKEDEMCLFKPGKKSLGVAKDLGLYSVAYQVDALGGSYGYRPRAEEGMAGNGSVFWFQIPIVLPEDVSLVGASVGAALEDVEDMLDSAVHRFPAGRHSSSKSSQHMACQTSAEDQALRSAGILAVAAAAATSMPPSNSCCGLDELAKFDDIQAYKDYQRRNRSTSPGMQTATTNGSSPDPSLEEAGSSAPNNKNGSCTESLWKNTKKIEIEAQPTRVEPLFILPVEEKKRVSPKMQSFPRTILISKESEAAKGSVYNANPSTAMGADASPGSPRQKKALVIEDTVVVRKTLTRALQKRGYEVTQAKDGLEGLDALKTTVFDITLCDFLMPNMDGLDCVKAYRQWEHVNRSGPQYIVGISAHCSQKDVNKGLEIGMDGFKSKPITMKILQNLDESPKMDLVRQRLDKLYWENQEQCLVETEASPSLDHSQTGLDNSVTTQRKSCLMATVRSNAKAGIAQKMTDEGWDVTIVKNGKKALDRLKSLNWGAVVLDDELPQLSGNQCVEEFRAWERQNRVNRQDNIFIVCTHVVLSDPDTCMLPPAGFDGAVGGEVSWNHLQSLISRQRSSNSVMRNGLSIVTR